MTHGTYFGEGKERKWLRAHFRSLVLFGFLIWSFYTLIGEWLLRLLQPYFVGDPDISAAIRYLLKILY